MNLPRRALIAIDVQNEYVTGGLPIRFPDVNVSLANISKAIDAANADHVPVVIVQNRTPPGSPLFASGSAGWQLNEAVANRHHDHYIEKQMPSAFAGTNLLQWIKDNSIETLTVVGYMTHNCVAATVFEALQAGLAVEVLSDATGSVPYANRAGRVSARQMHETFMVVFQSRFAAVMTTDRWITHLIDRTTPDRDTIFGSHQQAAIEARAMA